MKEIWKAIKDYEGKYEVSNLGRVKSLERTSRLNRKIKERNKTQLWRRSDEKKLYKFC